MTQAPARLVFLDELGVNLAMTRAHGRAPRGERAHGAAPCNPDPNVTPVFAVRLSGLLAPWALLGAMDVAAYVTYLRTQLLPRLRPGDIVRADRLGMRRSAAPAEVFAGTGIHYVLLSPYSPDYTPVENAGSQVKRAVRSEAPRTVNDQAWGRRDLLFATR